MLNAEVIISIFENRLREKIANIAIIKLQKRYPKVVLDFLRFGRFDSVFSSVMYNKIQILLSDTEAIDAYPTLQAEYDSIYSNELYLEIDRLVEKLIKE